jgi:chromosomal replication initiation ATPase DnaA
MWLCCRLTGESTGAIAKILNRDHTTIIHGRDQVQRKYELDPKIANELIDLIMECLQEARLACTV